MSKVQSDFFWRWAGTRAEATESITTTATLAVTTELANIDASGGAYDLTLMPVADIFDPTATVATSRMMMLNGDANLASNNVTIKPNGTGVTINGDDEFVLRGDNQQVLLYLQGLNWLVVGNTRSELCDIVITDDDGIVFTDDGQIVTL